MSRLQTPDNHLGQQVHNLKQKARAELVVPLHERKQRIQQVIDMLVAEEQALTTAIEQDYQGRSRPFSVMTDILGSLASLKFTRDNVHKWLEPQPKEMIAPYNQMGATAYIVPQPKGLVGIMGTWNYPLFTLFSPLACVLGAGNKAFLKPSDVTPHTALAIEKAVKKHLDSDVVEVITGDMQVSIEFASQPWDHLVFTGSTQTGKKIMAAAANNLVPVTLELGGKSPAIVGQSADIDEAARRLAIAKGTNSGQICVCPDTIFVPEAAKAQFLAMFMQTYRDMYPSVTGNSDVVPVVNDIHVNRLSSYISELSERGIEFVQSHDVSRITDGRMPLTAVINPPTGSLVMQNELFGPIAVVRTYQHCLEVIRELQQQEKPLALYYFGQNDEEKAMYLANTTSGGVTVNDAMLHAALHDTPFGGVGMSGMGAYHGEDGFWQFSHKRSVFEAPDYDFRADYGLLPPYSEQFAHMMLAQVTK